MTTIYPMKLTKLLEKENLSYIPRKVTEKEYLKRYCRYWQSEYSGYFKIYDIYHIKKNEYYSVKYNDGLYAELPYPVDGTLYELLIDQNHIQNIDQIINSSTSYTGYEIRYWFWKHHINLNSPKYRGFSSFIYPNSKSTILEDKYYFIIGKELNGKYKNCKVIVDK